MERSSPVSRLAPLLSIREEEITGENYQASKAHLERLLCEITRNRTHLSKRQIETVNQKVPSLLENLSRAKAASSLPKGAERSLKLIKGQIALLTPTAITLAKQEREREAISRLSEELRNRVTAGGEIAGTIRLAHHYWGEAMPLKLDPDSPPFHIHGEAIAPWWRVWSQGATGMSFDSYVRSHVSQSMIDELVSTKSVRYLTPSERAEYVVSFVSSQLLDRQGVPLHGKYIFVIDPTEEHLYMGKKSTGRFHHSSFLAGGAVKSTGGAEIAHGQIVLLTNSSGHYRPTAEAMGVMLAFLADPKRLGEEASQIPTRIR